MRKSFKKALALTLSASMVFSVPMVNNSEIQAYADGISGDLTVTNFFGAKTNAVAVEDGQTATFTFKNKSNGSKNYENFTFVVTGATGAAYTGVDQEIAIIRADNWGWGGGMSSFVAPDSQDNTKTKLAFICDINWDEFPSLMAAGADCKVTFKKEGNTIYYKANIGKFTVSTTDTSTVDLPSTVYVFFTGENCTLTGFNTTISNPVVEPETTTSEPETTTVVEPETTTVAEPETTTVAEPETTTVAEPETTTVNNDSPNAGDPEEESTTVKNDSPGTGDPEEESTTVKNDSPGTGDIEEETTDNGSPDTGDVEEEPDRIRYNGELDCSGWWVAHTPSVKVGKNGVVYSFVSTTYANATLNWNTPIVVLYTADEEFAGGAGLSGTAGYSEYYVVRSDLYGWAPGNKNTNTNPELMPTRVEPSNWATWLADNKAGVECKVTVKVEDGNAVLTFENDGVKSVSVIPVDTAKPLYFSVSGEKCVLSGEKAQVVEPTGVTVKDSKVSLEVDKTATIEATVAPADATDKTLTYKSSNTAVATVSATGKITAVKAGTATITVSTVNGKTATVEVTVTKKPVTPTVVAPTGVSVAAKAVTLEVGKTSAIKATVAPANATNKTVTYKSSNTAVATVSATGVITAIKAGTATITVSTVNGKTATVVVTVKAKAATVVNPTGVSVKAKTVALEVGKTSQIVATVAPANATNKTLTYTSSKPSVATVSSTGKITAKAAGTATITVKTVNGKTAAVVVTVKAAKVANKSIKNVPSSVTLEKGKTLTLKPTVTKGTTDKITYKSSKSKIASVSSKGKISAKKNGSATITVTCGKVKKTVKVKVVNKNTKLTVSKKTVTLKKGKKTTVTAKTSANTVPVTATSSKTKVAKVTVKSKKITIKAVAKGTAKITVQCGSKKATVKVKVK